MVCGPGGNSCLFNHIRRSRSLLTSSPSAERFPGLTHRPSPANMDFHALQHLTVRSIDIITSTSQQVPGSAILMRYIRSSYQNDPVRSAIELILVVFFIRYLCASSYSTKNSNFVVLTENVGSSIDSKIQLD